MRKLIAILCSRSCDWRRTVLGSVGWISHGDQGLLCVIGYWGCAIDCINLIEFEVASDHLDEGCYGTVTCDTPLRHAHLRLREAALSLM